MYRPFMRMPMYGGGGHLFGIFGGLMMLVFWGLVIAGVVLLVKYVSNGAGMTPHFSGQASLDILKVRYAKGEIDKKEFDEKKKDLER